MTKIQFYIINLNTRPDRWEHVVSINQELGLNLNRVEGIDGRLINSEDWVDVNGDAFRRNKARNIMPGEYGCYRSHILALEKFIETKEAYAVVLEDDVVPDAQTSEKVEGIIEIEPNFDVIKLVNHRTSGFMFSGKTCSGDEIGRVLFGPQCSGAAYLVSRKGAMKILSSIRIMELPWDIALDNFWKYDGNFFTTKKNMFKLSEARGISNISPRGYNKKTFLRNLLRIFVLPIDHFNRFHLAAIGPKRAASMASRSPANILPKMTTMIFVNFAFLMMVSVFWFESHAYWLAALALAFPTLYAFLSKGFWRYDKPLMGWMGIICNFWAYSVIIRFIIDFLADDTKLRYVELSFFFPAIYTILAYALWAHLKKPFIVISAFMAISLLVLLFSTDYEHITSSFILNQADGDNTINASFTSAIFLIISFYYTTYAVENESFSTTRKSLFSIIGAMTFTISMANLISLNNEYVWSALIITLPLMFFFIFQKIWNKRKSASVKIPITILGILLMAFVVIPINNQQITTSETLVTASLDLFISIFSGSDLGQQLIKESEIPTFVSERFNLWTDALVIWQKNLFWGAGIDWHVAWGDRIYSRHIDSEVLQNSILEIGVRYGFSGIIFYFLIFGWCIRKLFLASKFNAIDPALSNGYLVLQIFFLTINLFYSIILDSIGISFILLSVTLGFYCAFRLQEVPYERPRTWC